jgi:hypothetical protein
MGAEPGTRGQFLGGSNKVSPRTKRHAEPRRVVKSTRPLTREQRVLKAVNIIGKDKVRPTDIEATLDQISKKNERSKLIRSEDSGKQKRFAKQYGLALRKVIRMMWRAPTIFRVPSALGPLAASRLELGTDKEVFFDHEHLLRHLELLNLICDEVEKSKLKGKPDAYEKRHAAEAALHLLKTHGIRPTMTRKTGESTKAGMYCKLAAVLYGDENAVLQYHCRKAVKGIRLALKFELNADATVIKAKKPKKKPEATATPKPAAEPKPEMRRIASAKQRQK